jgi:hypothetical protein
METKGRPHRTRLGQTDTMRQKVRMISLDCVNRRLPPVIFPAANHWHKQMKIGATGIYYMSPYSSCHLIYLISVKMVSQTCCNVSLKITVVTVDTMCFSTKRKRCISPKQCNLYIPYDSHVKPLLFNQTALTGLFLLWRRTVRWDIDLYTLFRRTKR